MKKLAFIPIILCILVFLIQPTLAAYIISWGSIALNSRELASKNFVAIAAGNVHSLALKSDGSIVGWGRNNYGQATPPAGNNFIAIAAGPVYSLALKSDGSIVAWGDNDSGQATPPDGNNFVAIAAGSSCSLALQQVPEPAKYSGGTGEPTDPYQIGSAQDLLALAADTNDYGKCFILTANIDLQGQVWTTAIIAADTNSTDEYHEFQGTAFTGTFDGNGHKVTHFTINGGSNDYLGLFGYIDFGGSVKNLGLENCAVSGDFFVGGLVGWNYDGSISNCHSTGSVSGDRFVGGIVGLNYDSISNCYSTGAVSGYSDIGGLVGGNYGSISNCYSTGVVSGDYWIGGLVGWNYGSISNCYSTGAVSGSSWCVGGLVGINGRGPVHGNIINCYSTGAVSGSGAGGLVGANEYGSNISNSFWDVNTSGQAASAGGTGKMTAKMKTLSTFTSAGWDFNTPVWIINEGVDYPHLWWENTAPVADAGPNQVAYAWIDGIAEVNIDGSASYDDDDDELTYLWTWSIDGNDYEANGVSPTIELPVGQHTIELVVNDGRENSEPNYTVITVIGPIEGTLWITPQIINRRCEQRRIMTMLRLPAGITKDQIDSNSTLLFYPGEVESVNQFILPYYANGARRVCIFAFFDRDEILKAIGGNGPVQVYVVGQLKTGQYFYGSDTIRIINPGRQPTK